MDSHQEILRKLLDFCVKHDLTLILSWTFEEAGNYICFAKEHELSSQKQTSIIKGQQAEDYNSSIQAALTTIRAINKTDVSNLLGNLKSFDKIVTESSAIDSSNTLGKIHGLGRTKVDNMKQIFLEPFIYNKDYENI